MESIIRKVRAEYAHYTNIDVSLLSESGDFQVIYHGPAMRLKMQEIETQKVKIKKKRSSC